MSKSENKTTIWVLEDGETYSHAEPTAERYDDSECLTEIWVFEDGTYSYVVPTKLVVTPAELARIEDGEKVTDVISEPEQFLRDV